MVQGLDHGVRIMCLRMINYYCNAGFSCGWMDIKPWSLLKLTLQFRHMSTRWQHGSIAASKLVGVPAHKGLLISYLCCYAIWVLRGILP